MSRLSIIDLAHGLQKQTICLQAVRRCLILDESRDKNHENKDRGEHSKHELQ